MKRVIPIAATLGSGIGATEFFYNYGARHEHGTGR